MPGAIVKHFWMDGNWVPAPPPEPPAELALPPRKIVSKHILIIGR